MARVRTSDILTKRQTRAMDIAEHVLRRRLARMGDDDSGLYGFYRDKLERDQLLYDYDMGAIAFLRGLAPTGRIVEIGAGVGQLSIALAADGHGVVPLERNQRRYAALEDILEQLRGEDPLTAAKVAPRLGSFPDIVQSDDLSGDVAVIFNCMFAGEDQRAAFLRALPRFKGALIDFRTLFTHAEEGEWRDRAAAFCAEFDCEGHVAFDYSMPSVNWMVQVYYVTPRASGR